MLLPLLAAADSHPATGTAGAALSATAHLNFRIIIPKVLSLDAPGPSGVAGANTVAIMSNNRNVSLTVTAAAPPANAAAPPAKAAHGDIILSAAARKVIVQDAACAASSGAAPVICTASMP
ncbi:MAG TPA: hypothetical protein VKG63_05010 [Steroidobacteraceae bacterium]|nr:hypothetical protein [Steroidobacteraceae bacterium]